MSELKIFSKKSEGQEKVDKTAVMMEPVLCNGL